MRRRCRCRVNTDPPESRVRSPKRLDAVRPAVVTERALRALAGSDSWAPQAGTG